MVYVWVTVKLCDPLVTHGPCLTSRCCPAWQLIGPIIAVLRDSLLCGWAFDLTIIKAAYYYYYQLWLSRSDLVNVTVLDGPSLHNNTFRTAKLDCKSNLQHTSGKLHSGQNSQFTVTVWKKWFLTTKSTNKHQFMHHKAKVSLKNLRTVVPTEVEDVISVWYEIYNTSRWQHTK